MNGGMQKVVQCQFGNRNDHATSEWLDSSIKYLMCDLILLMQEESHHYIIIPDNFEVQ